MEKHDRSPAKRRGLAGFLREVNRGFAQRSNLSRYGLAVAVTVAAAVCTLALRPLLQFNLTPLFSAAVVISAWYGGLGPGLIATTGAVLLIEALSGLPAPARAPAPGDLSQLIILALIAIGTALFHAFWSRDRLSILRANDELERRVRLRTEELSRLNAELRASEERFRHLFEDAPLAYHEIDAEGRITRVNRCECEMLGRSAEEMIGRPVWEMVAPDQRDFSRAQVERKLAEGLPVAPFIRQYETRDGSRLWFEIHERVIRDASGTIAGMRSAMLDITSRVAAEEEIRRLNAELEKRVEERTSELQRSNEDLQQFAYVASHDLQEPLRIIGSYSELLSRRYSGRLDPDADEFISFITDATARMRQLIHDLLQFSRVGSRDLRPLEPVPLGRAVDEALENLRFAVEDSGARVERGELPVVMGDLPRLTQVFQNLIANAIKYRSDALPVVRISAERDGRHWSCSVSDNGIGFDPRFAERIFGIFKRLHGSEFPGTGMGLAIVRRIVEHHQGRIWATSEPGRGSCFTFTLKVVEQTSPAAEAPAQPENLRRSAALP